MAGNRYREAEPPKGPDCAAGILEGPDFRLVWCNRLAYRLFDKPYRSADAIGLPLEQINPILFAAQSRSLREAMFDGTDCSGADKMFSVERGITTFRWALHQISPGRILALVQVERSQA